MTRNERGGYRPKVKMKSEKGMKRVTRMYLHMMPICLSKSGEKDVMGDNLFIYETVYN